MPARSARAQRSSRLSTSDRSKLLEASSTGMVGRRASASARERTLVATTGRASYLLRSTRLRRRSLRANLACPFLPSGKVSCYDEGCVSPAWPKWLVGLRHRPRLHVAVRNLRRSRGCSIGGTDPPRDRPWHQSPRFLRYVWLGAQ